MKEKDLTPEQKAKIEELYKKKSKLPEGDPERNKISREIMILYGLKPGQFRDMATDSDTSNNS